MPCRKTSRAYIARILLLPSILVVYTVHAADTELPVKIEEIVVTATPYLTDSDKLATIVSQVNRNEILRNGGANLADALANIPGVTGSSFAAGASRPIIRGFDASRVKVMENGIGSFDVADVGPDHGTPIDPLSTQEVEVVRGAATLRYGSQAIGGVVNAINNRVPFAALEKPFSGEASGTFATGSDLYEGAAMVDARSGKLAFHADAFGRHTGDYNIPGGVQSNSFFRGEGLSFGTAYIGDQAKTGGAIVRYSAHYGIPAENSYIDMTQTKGLARSAITFESGPFNALNIDTGYADYSHSEKDGTGSILSTFTDKEWDSRAEALLSPNDVLSAGAVGVQAQHRKFTALGEGQDYLLPTTTQSVAAFTFAEAPLSEILKLQMGARVEHLDAKGTPLSNLDVNRTYTPISGSAGIVLSPTDVLTLGATFSSAARAPGQTELFARGPHDGPQTFELGDPNLRIERSNSVEGTIRMNHSHITFEGAAWAAHFDNFIYGRVTGRTCDEEGNCIIGNGNDLREVIYEQRKAKFRGLEGKVTFALVETTKDALVLDVLADTVRATVSGADNVPRIPPYHVGAGLNWTSDIISAGLQWRYSGKQTKTAASETPTDGYSSLDARISFKPRTQQPDVEFSVIGRNLTNSTQRSAVAFNKDEVILPGRDVRFTIRSSF